MENYTFQWLCLSMAGITIARAHAWSCKEIVRLCLCAEKTGRIAHFSTKHCSDRRKVLPLAEKEAGIAHLFRSFHVGDLHWSEFCGILDLKWAIIPHFPRRDGAYYRNLRKDPTKMGFYSANSDGWQSRERAPDFILPFSHCWSWLFTSAHFPIAEVKS